MAVDILEAHTTPADPSDRYGQVSHGLIRLEGILAFDPVTTTTKPRLINGELSELGVPRRTITCRYLGDFKINFVLYLDAEGHNPGGLPSLLAIFAAVWRLLISRSTDRCASRGVHTTWILGCRNWSATKQSVSLHEAM